MMILTALSIFFSKTNYPFPPPSFQNTNRSDPNSNIERLTANFFVSTLLFKIALETSSLFEIRVHTPPDTTNEVPPPPKKRKLWKSRLSLFTCLSS